MRYAAMDTARKQGKIRFAGASTHDRPHNQMDVRTYPEIFHMVVTAVQRRSKVHPKRPSSTHSRKWTLGCLGIKPFSDNTCL